MPERTKLIEALVESGLVSVDEARVLREDPDHAGPVSTQLLALGKDGAAVLRAVSNASGLTPIPPGQLRAAEDDLAEQTEHDVCWRLLAAPFATKRNILLVAFADPRSATLALQEGLLPPHEPFLALEDDVRRVLTLLFGVDPLALAWAAADAERLALETEWASFDEDDTGKKSAELFTAQAAPSLDSWSERSAKRLALGAQRDEPQEEEDTGKASASPGPDDEEETGKTAASPGHAADDETTGPSRPAPGFDHVPPTAVVDERPDVAPASDDALAQRLAAEADGFDDENFATRVAGPGELPLTAAGKSGLDTARITPLAAAPTNAGLVDPDADADAFDGDSPTVAIPLDPGLATRQVGMVPPDRTLDASAFVVEADDEDDDAFATIATTRSSLGLEGTLRSNAASELAGAALTSPLSAGGPMAGATEPGNPAMQISAEALQAALAGEMDDDDDDDDPTVGERPVPGATLEQSVPPARGVHTAEARRSQVEEAEELLLLDGDDVIVLHDDEEKPEADEAETATDDEGRQDEDDADGAPGHDGGAPKDATGFDIDIDFADADDDDDALSPGLARSGLERFAVGERLGVGGMAEVFRAADEMDGRPVAVKMLHEHLKDDPDSRARFEREDIAGRGLAHANIVRVLDADTGCDRPYIVTELVEGGDVSGLVQHAGGRLPVVLAARIVGEMLRALEYAHGEGIVHRDLKPENLLVSPEGVVKVSDFGVAWLIDGDNPNSGTTGTPQYMSPEQVRGQDLDGRSDLFSVGVVFYELIAGRNPFLDANPSTTLMKITQGKLPPIFESDPTVPAAVERVIENLLVVDRDRRYRNAAMALSDLVPFLSATHDRYPDMVAKALQDPGGYSAHLRKDQAAAEVARGEELLDRDGRSNRAQAALAFFRASLLDPNHPKPAERLKQLKERDGIDFSARGDRRIIAIRDALRADPNDGDLLKTLAELYRKQGDIYRGALNIKRYLRNNPDDPGAIAKLVWMVGEPGASPFGTGVPRFDV